MEKFIRSFIAIELPSQTHEYLASVIDRLKKADVDAKWVKPANIHLTLKFLGNVPEKQIEDIKQTLDRTAVKHLSFHIELGGIGAFPKIDYPRVIWVGINQGKEKLKKLTEDIEVELIELGFEPEDRDFSPHLTLARIKTGRNRERLKKIVQDLNSPGCPETLNLNSVSVERLTLFQSTLTPKGSIYTVLHQAQLQK